MAGGLGQRGGRNRPADLPATVACELSDARFEIDAKDRHLEDVRAAASLVVEEQDADEFLTEIGFDRILLARPPYHPQLLVIEFALQVSVQPLGILRAAFRFADRNFHA